MDPSHFSFKSVVPDLNTGVSSHTLYPDNVRSLQEKWESGPEAEAHALVRLSPLAPIF